MYDCGAMVERTDQAGRRAGLVERPGGGKSQQPVLELAVRDRHGHQPSRELAGGKSRGGHPRCGGRLAGASLFLHAPSCEKPQEVAELGRGCEVSRHLASEYAGRGILVSGLLTYSSIQEGKEYLTVSFKSNQASELSLCVSNYAQYLDERLRCAHALMTHLDHRWKAEIKQNRVECMGSEELLHQLESRQNLLQELYQCDPGVEAGEHPGIRGALVLLVMDGYKVVSEIRFRSLEMLGRFDALALSESLAVLHNCMRAANQMQAWESFLEYCKKLRMLFDVPLPGRATVRKLEIQKLMKTIPSSQKGPSTSSLTTAVSTCGQGRTESLPLPVPSTARQPLRIHRPGHLQRTSSQPLSQLPRRVPGSKREYSYIPENVPYARHSSADLTDLSFDPDSSCHVDQSSVSQTRSETSHVWSQDFTPGQPFRIAHFHRLSSLPLS